MERMNIVFIITGLVLLTVVDGENISWVEMTTHRNSVHEANFIIQIIPTNVGCIALCTSTPGCLYVTYTFDTSTCTRHNQLQGKQVQQNSIIWQRDRPCLSPFGYNAAIGLCLFLSSVRRNWEDAKVDCESRTSRLLVANDQTKFLGVQSEFPGQALFWIGGFPRTSDGKWVWLTGELVTLAMFHPGQPSGGPGRLAYWNKNNVLKLDDTFPHELHPYICESF